MFEENRQGPADGKTNFWGKVKMPSYTPPASCEKQAMFALSPLCYIVELNLEMPITSPK
jgi:hypothetical protein